MRVRVCVCVCAMLFIEKSLGAPWCGCRFCRGSAFLGWVCGLCTWLEKYFLFFFLKSFYVSVGGKVDFLSLMWAEISLCNPDMSGKDR